jgi:hypothetical protein
MVTVQEFPARVVRLAPPPALGPACPLCKKPLRSHASVGTIK